MDEKNEKEKAVKNRYPPSPPLLWDRGAWFGAEMATSDI